MFMWLPLGVVAAIHATTANEAKSDQETNIDEQLRV